MSAMPPAEPPSGADEGHVSGLDLEQLLTQLVDRAQDIRSAHRRLRGLLEANTSIISDLSLEVVLRRIVEAACALLDARYGALGVVSPDGHGLEQFVHVGIDDALVTEIGGLPQGKGVLGALIDDPAPISLHELSDDPRSVGFPAGHPPMHTFLGVPIAIRGEVFGNLYLTERASGDFTPEDVELASAFAATAAVAIDNARLFEDARRRQDWLRATAEVSTIVVTDDGASLRLVAEQVHRLARADIVTLVLPEAENTRLAVEVAVGVSAAELEGTSYPTAGTITGVVLDSGAPIMVADDTGPDGLVLRLRDTLPVGPAMVLPLTGGDRVRGALVVGRFTTGRRFTDSDLEMATTFAAQAAVALELAETRRDRERIRLFEERDRIARDLHDHVIQSLFAAGLTLQGVSLGLAGSEHADRIESVVETLDDSIKQIRHSIFELRDHHGPQGQGVRAAIMAVAATVAPLLGFEPAVRFGGPVDTAVDEGLADDLVAVVREGLTNVAKHAGATGAEVSLTVSAERVELRIADDGAGLGDPARRSGLGNLASRAGRHGGALTTSTPHQGSGTILLWVVPLPRP
jgi:signal transduction histidine kinase